MKKIIVFILLAGILCGLCACGQKNTDIANTSHTEEANNHIDENGNPIQNAETPFGKTGRSKSYKVFNKDTDLFCFNEKDYYFIDDYNDSICKIDDPQSGTYSTVWHYDDGSIYGLIYYENRIYFDISDTDATWEICSIKCDGSDFKKLGSIEDVERFYCFEDGMLYLFDFHDTCYEVNLAQSEKQGTIVFTDLSQEGLYILGVFEGYIYYYPAVDFNDVNKNCVELQRYRIKTGKFEKACDLKYEDAVNLRKMDFTVGMIDSKLILSEVDSCPKSLDVRDGTVRDLMMDNFIYNEDGIIIISDKVIYYQSDKGDVYAFSRLDTATGTNEIIREFDDTFFTMTAAGDYIMFYFGWGDYPHRIVNINDSFYKIINLKLCELKKFDKIIKPK